MGKTSELDPISQRFVWLELNRYYSTEFKRTFKELRAFENRRAREIRTAIGNDNRTGDIPYGMQYREYALIPISNSSLMKRHFSFLGGELEKDLHSWIQNERPRHLYYSSCFREDPLNPNTWWGADLVFDIDADDIPSVKDSPWEIQLEAARDHMDMLVNDFLLGDLNFRREEILVNFSGGRGYHARVSSPRVLGFDSAERREVMQYIMGTGMKVINHLNVVTSPSSAGHTITDYYLYPPDYPGWMGRLSRHVLRLKRHLKDLGDKKGREFWRNNMSVSSMYTRFLKAASELETENRLKVSSTWMEHKPDPKKDTKIPGILEDLVKLYSVHLDTAVTADINRLIRLPGSIHGSSGLVVKTMKPGDVARFDPLLDAIPKTFYNSGNMVRIEAVSHFKSPFADGTELNTGDSANIPEFTALYAVLKGLAKPKPRGQ